MCCARAARSDRRIQRAQQLQRARRVVVNAGALEQVRRPGKHRQASTSALQRRQTAAATSSAAVAERLLLPTPRAASARARGTPPKHHVGERDIGMISGVTGRQEFGATEKNFGMKPLVDAGFELTEHFDHERLIDDRAVFGSLDIQLSRYGVCCPLMEREARLSTPPSM